MSQYVKVNQALPLGQKALEVKGLLEQLETAALDLARAVTASATDDNTYAALRDLLGTDNTDNANIVYNLALSVKARLETAEDNSSQSAFVQFLSRVNRA